MIHVCMGIMTLIAAIVLCVKTVDSLLSVSMRKVQVLFSTAGFNGGGKPCPKILLSFCVFTYPQGPEAAIG